jgi:pimeloyl-ACP methyl ester carboxylesterase
MSQFATIEEVERDVKPDDAADSAPAPLDALRERVVGWIGRRRETVLGLHRLASLYFAQTRLIFPGGHTQGLAHSHVRPIPGSELVRLRTSCGQDAVALFGPALTCDGHARPDAASRSTLLYFYGNNQHLADAHVARLFHALRRLGVNVLIPEYVGYGMSTGDAGETACYATADAAYAHLRSRPDVDAAKIVVAGASLGGAVAIDLASRERTVAGVITLVTFTSMSDMARVVQPTVPIHRFIRHRFESERKMPRVTCPALIVHSTGDALVPYSMSDRLASACAGPVTRLKIEGAGHSSVEVLEGGGGAIYEAMTAFLSRISPPFHRG